MFPTDQINNALWISFIYATVQGAPEDAWEEQNTLNENNVPYQTLKVSEIKNTVLCELRTLPIKTDSMSDKRATLVNSAGDLCRLENPSGLQGFAHNTNWRLLSRKNEVSNSRQNRLFSNTYSCSCLHFKWKSSSPFWRVM